MGACMAVANSSKPLMEAADIDGTDKDYYEKFIEDKVLGSGSFGEVKQVFYSNPKNGGEPLACKRLHKGLQFKGNTLYSPINRSALRAECLILRALKGEHYTIKLEAMFENSSYLWLVMEFCSGGEMMEYIVKQKELRTDDISRISYQILDALDHCEKHGVIHRDLKPENIMFKDPSEGSPLRIIDFGSSSYDADGEAQEKPVIDDNGLPLVQHSTFAGSAFYISPELFQRTYTYKTDIWSAGVTLYVLVAGFPAEKLQKAFNILHTSKDRNLKSLPGLDGEDLPDSYFEMLDELLRYRHKQRKCARDILCHEFVQFHKGVDEAGEEQELDIADVAAEAAGVLSTEGGTTIHAGTGKGTGRLRRTQSTVMKGTVERHTMYMGYQNFERSLTALLATLLTKGELKNLIESLESFMDGKEGEDSKLKAIKIRELKEIMESLDLTIALGTMMKLPNIDNYMEFSYRLPLLLDFVRHEEVGRDMPASQGGRSKSVHATNNVPSSVHGNDVFEKWRKNSMRKRTTSASNLTTMNSEMNVSAHI